MKYTFIDDDIYCDKCGNKNIPEPTGNYDNQTGKPEAYRWCMNEKCTQGQEYYAAKKQKDLEKKYCQKGHDYGFFHLHNNNDVCKKCGYVDRDTFLY